jgi:UrcA family protein
MTRTLIAAFVAAAALSLAAPASAKETVTYAGGDRQASVTVSTAGYNLDTPRGAARFAAVLERAVKRVCDIGADRTLAARHAEQVCEAETMRTTLAGLDKPYVTAALGVTLGNRIVLAAR